MHKDIIFNHDMFISNNRHNYGVTSQAEDTRQEELCTPSQIMIFAQNALLKVIEENKWPKNNIEIEKQMSEASFIFRRVVQSLGSQEVTHSSNNDQMS